MVRWAKGSGLWMGVVLPRTTLTQHALHPAFLQGARLCESASSRLKLGLFWKVRAAALELQSLASPHRQKHPEETPLSPSAVAESGGAQDAAS